jgi:hypothetical protein
MTGTDLGLPPSTPDPSLTTLVYTLIRAVLYLLSGLGIGVGALDDGALMIVAGGIVAVGTAAWSLWDKIQAARANHRNSVASAIAGKPVDVVAGKTT